MRIKNGIKPDDFTRINNDVNGNPRYVLHFVRLRRLTDTPASEPTNYLACLAAARPFGGRKFHNKQYGGGIVFTEYCTTSLCKALNSAIYQAIKAKGLNP